jgi:hypothetical protein
MHPDVYSSLKGYDFETVYTIISPENKQGRHYCVNICFIYSYWINDATQKLRPSIHVRLRMTQVRVKTYTKVINSKIKQIFFFFFFFDWVEYRFLISIGRNMSEVILNSVSRKKIHNGVETSAVQEIRLQNFLSGESLSPVPVKHEHFIYISLTSPYWNALHIVNHNIHRIPVFRKAVGGETWKKILFPAEILVFDLIPFLTIYIWNTHRT